jgi:hypothetical protein
MPAINNYSKGFMLAVVLGFLLFMSFAFGLLPGASTAIASPGAGWVDHDVKGGTPLSITSINPNTGCQGDYVSLNGVGFGSAQDPSYVSFGDFQATVTTSYDTYISCEVPPITGVTFPVTVPVTVTNANGTSNAMSFTVLEPVTITSEPVAITSISPPFWFSNSYTGITITGTGFQSGATLILMSSTNITCEVTIPKYSEMLAPEILSVPPFYAIVTNPDGSRASGGTFSVCYNLCGDGAVISIMGFGLMMGIMTLAGSSKLRRRLRRRNI